MHYVCLLLFGDLYFIDVLLLFGGLISIWIFVMSLLIV